MESYHPLNANLDWILQSLKISDLIGTESGNDVFSRILTIEKYVHGKFGISLNL